MRLFASVGPLGAGKTTLTVNTIRALIDKGLTTKDRCAYVINDDGGAGMVDGQVVSEAARVVPMVNGCFTCSDEADLRKTLADLESAGMEWVFIEGFGITSGTETKTFLKSCPYSFYIVAVVDHRHFSQNQVRYGKIVDSQIHAATLGTAITKFPEDAQNVMDERLTTEVDHISRCSHGKPIFLITEGGHVPLSMLEGEGLRGKPSVLHVHGNECNHDHSHGVHGIYPYSFQLRSAVFFDSVRRIFSRAPESIIRIKGAVDGKLFNAVHDDWKQTLPDNRHFVTFYSTVPMDPLKDIPYLEDIIVISTESRDLDRKSYELMRTETVSREETVTEIIRLIDVVHNEVQNRTFTVATTNGSYRLITHPESLQILKEIARRPYVKDEWFVRALEACMEYWLATAEFLRVHETKIVENELAVNKRELGVSITWWLHQFSRELWKFRERAELIRPSEMTAEGMLRLTTLNYDPERAYWQQKELRHACRYFEPKKINAIIFSALRHAYSIDRSERKNGWLDEINNLKGP